MGKGQFVFKGDKKPKKNKKRKRIEEGVDADDVDNSEYNAAGMTTTRTTTTTTDGSNAIETTSAATKASSSTAAATPSIRNGTGLITTSGTVVTGYDTKFEKEVSVGDAILVTLPDGEDDEEEELRVVTMRLSNTSLNLSSAFSKNLKHPQSYRYIRKPKNIPQEQRDQQQKQLEQAKEREKSVFDLYTNDSLVYREKTETGSYRIVKQQKDDKKGQQQGSSRGDLLDMRSKKTSDKYC